MAGNANEAVAKASKRRRVFCMIRSCDLPQRYHVSALPGTALRPAEVKRKLDGTDHTNRAHAIANQRDKGPREEAMRRLLQSSLVLCALALALPAAAQVEAPVPVEKAPFHVPVFRNEYVTLVNVYIPAGRTAGYHTHSLDQISVLVSETEMTGQVLGEQPTPPRRNPRG